MMASWKPGDDLTKLVFRGVHEICRKRVGGGISHVGYFDSAEAVLAVVESDKKYEAIYASLNPLPAVPEGFVLNELKPSPHRSKKDDYSRRRVFLIDCDPVRKHGNATDAEVATARAQAETVRHFLCDEMQWPRPVMAASGNGTHLRFDIDEPADVATEELFRRLLSGLAAKFNTDTSKVDTCVFDANRVCKMYNTWARKAPEEKGRPWRLSGIIEAPTREIELPAAPGKPRETIVEFDLESVPRSLIESAISQLPIPQKASAGLEMSANDSLKYEWLRDFLLEFNVAILAERSSGNRLLLDVLCPWEAEHGHTTGDTSTSAWYVRGHGYGFKCHHASCAERGWPEFRKQVDSEQAAKNNLPGLPPDATHSLVARYFRDACPEFHNHARVYDAGRTRATFVGSRWDLQDQSNILLMATLQPVCDRLRWDLPEPFDDSHDYRQKLDSHPFRSCVMLQIVPMLDKIRFDMLDQNGYLIGLPGGQVGDLRTGQARQMERSDFLTRRLRIIAKQGEPEVYDYFLRSISSANDQPADSEWMQWMERLLGYCLLGALPYHLWPIWSGEGGNGKSCLARLVSYILSEFCALVRWSELVHDERGSDNVQKRLNARLIGARCAVVEEMGETAGGHGGRVLETSAIKNVTGNGELVGAFMRENDIRGPSNVKLLTLLNRPPLIERDAAMERRVQIFPFRAMFDESKHPGCLKEAMDHKNAPAILREQPFRIEALMRAEAPAILWRWMQSCREFIESGETMDAQPKVIRAATMTMFNESDLHGRFCDERLVFAPDLEATLEELRSAGEAFERECASPLKFDMAKLGVELKNRGCIWSANPVWRDGTRKRFWSGVKVAVATVKIGP